MNDVQQILIHRSCVTTANEPALPCMMMAYNFLQRREPEVNSISREFLSVSQTFQDKGDTQKQLFILYGRRGE